MGPRRRAQGAKTVIAAPDGSVAVAPFENPALATGGTGDVLSGAIGSLLAQRLTPFAAARLGVYLHGLAGDAVSERIGDAGMLASDLPDALAIARKRLSGVAERRAARSRLGFGSRDVPGQAPSIETPDAPQVAPVGPPTVGPDGGSRPETST